MSSNSSPVKIPPTLTDRVITQAIAIVFFVILPTLITLMVPLSKIEFRHTDSGVTATVERYVLIFLHFKTEQIVNVNSVRADITARKRYQGTSEERRKGQKGVRLATGQVAILSDGTEVIVQASPELAKTIAAQFDKFAADKTSEPLTFDVYASWALSYILGGVATALCAFYVVCVALAVLLFPFKMIWSLMRGQS